MKFSLTISLFCFFIISFFIYKIEAGSDFLIVANGPFEEEVVRNRAPQRTVVALDGAANKLYKAKIAPTYILGDFDSLQEAYETEHINSFNFSAANDYFQLIPEPQGDDLVFEEHPLEYKSEWDNGKVTFVRAYCQNYTDLDKGIQFCAAKGAENITITGCLGGERTDHSFATLSILKRHHGNPYKLQLETQKEIIEFLKDETVSFNGSNGAKFGLFGFPKAEASSKGLVWEMDNYPLELGGSESACNILKDSNITITVKGEALMIRPNY